jgi:transposase
MSARIVNIDRKTPMLFPVDMRNWLPENHLVHFVVDAVELLNISSFRINNSGSGDRQYPPAMMLALLIYCYATGTFSSQRCLRHFQPCLQGKAFSDGAQVR